MSSADAVRERYAAGGLLGTLRLGHRPAVVIVDLQYGFTDPAYPPGFDLDDVVSATRVLVEVARTAEVPVWFTTIAFPTNGDGIAGTWLQKMPALAGLRRGDRSTEIDERLAMRPGDRLQTKETASAFAYTGLSAALKSEGIDTIVVAGATTSGCVRATVVDACAADIPALVVRDCVGDREAGPHDAALLDIDAKYGDVVSLAEALDYLKGLS